ncbi:MAG: LysM peptidoglycan-binding domain-containing protein [Desulfobulbaceae bacterium]|nr:LysM peptidoglycan-binding domain-containing protein [Desulfobulbaceae bacterium]
MTPLKHLNFIFLLGLFFSLACAGCVSKNSTQQAKTEVEAPIEYPGAIYEQGDEASPAGYYIHTVKLPDESISIIAKWFTGDLMNWEVLAKHNPTINPNRIFLGNKIRIPRDIMTRHTPMTPEFIEASQPQTRRKKPESPAQATKQQIKAEPEPASPTVQATPEPVVEDEPLLFGPKGYSKD